MDHIKQYILEQVGKNKLPEKEAKEMLLELKKSSSGSNEEEGIAIIGMGCKFANSDTPDEYWENLINGNSCLIDFPEDRRKYFSPLTNNPHYAEFLGNTFKNEPETKAEEGKAGYLKDIDKFDAAFFNIPPREARFMDPAQRLFLETAWNAVEDAGYGGNKLYGSDTGIFLGRDCTSGTFYRYITERDPMHLTGTWEGILASRLNYIFNFSGPSMVIDTACSSGLVAVHMAAQALRNNECEMAIAGGISIGTSAQQKDEDEEADALNTVSSADNLVRTFDRKSTGTVFGEGIGTLFLKKLSKAKEDGDQIYAVIKGSAINNDGASNGITAPNPKAQEDVITRAWKQAKIKPETVSYIEAHGTGTLLGDPIEIKGITRAFRKYTNKNQFCGIGSAKTSMGHLVGASGLAGIIKVILSLKNEMIPANLNFEEPNQHIDFPNSPLFVVDKNKEWKRSSTPRRGAISSFGFSGTNCHMILEEAPVKEPAVSRTPVPHLLFLSAKKEHLLKELVYRYADFLHQDPDISLEDLCYTASTGRGHFSHRLAVIAHDLDELRTKLRNLTQQSFKQIEEEGVYYGFWKIVSDKRASIGENELTDHLKKQLNLEVQSFIKIFDTADQQHLQLLGDYYVRNADIEWESLYPAGKKASLPTYPFERNVYWGEIKVSKLKGNEGFAKPKHPMVEKCLSQSMDQDVYMTKFSREKHWVLSDHVLFGVAIIPGTAYVDMAREIGSMYYPESGLEFRDITFLAPIAVEDGTEKEVHLIVQKQEDHLHFKAVSKTIDPETEAVSWNSHTKMSIYPLEQSCDRYCDIQSIRNQPDMKEVVVDKEELTSGKNTVKFGPRWLNAQHVYKGRREVVAELKLPTGCENDLNSYPLHPGMLDNAVNASTQSFGDGNIYLPLGYRSFKLYAPMPERFYTHITHIPKEEKTGGTLETLTFNIELSDENGKPFAIIEDYVIKKIHAHTIGKLGNRQRYFETVWEQEELPSVSEKQPKNVLVFTGEKAICHEFTVSLKEQGNQLIEVRFGEEYEQRNKYSYVINGRPESYKMLLEDTRDLSVQQIIHMSSLTAADEITDINEFENAQLRGLDSFYHLFRAIEGEKSLKSIELVLISDYASAVSGEEKAIKPLNQSFLALAKVVVQESGKIKCITIDIDDATEAETLINEINSSQPDFRTAYRTNQKYKEVFTGVEAGSLAKEEASLSNGLYVITGGTGGIGMEMAKYIASKQTGTIALLSRSGLPPKSEWNNLVETSAEASIAEKLKVLQEIEAGGSEIHSYAADVCNHDEMRLTLDQLRQNHGPIKGIIHCAGVAGDGFLITKEQRVFDSVINPKVRGTWILDQLTRKDPIELFVSFSSISTLFGSRGQGDYTAANAYLNAFSDFRRQGGLKAITINWPAWSETGMAVDYKVSDQVALFKSVNNQEAHSIMDQAVANELTNVIPGQLNYKMFASTAAQELPIKLSSSIARELKKHAQKETNEPKSKERKEVYIIGKSTDYTKTETTLARIYAYGLDIEEIDIYENFNTLGGDSILATEVLKEIEKEYEGLVDLTDMFSYPTVSEMAQFIDEKSGVAEAASTTENEEDQELLDLLDNLESGEEDISSLMAKMTE
ncbi:SDR family NAD(P)-dependent oxidoreductase [Viridibacillus sp. YIM B01967]|uniref:SDR family NAD(P)-dependent oxidoreductase n=1 Tax=Viridibacillus soli TaxID=2798301 RepID=A0ABS1H5P3_9BACL|nr:SDR family NAD(P)-dependent oxidoreductase [Viridibacillus soli]MBK3494739.1 SDR family NAD(P)-dependent oxidoreductase [Viridibacillus soli]